MNARRTSRRSILIGGACVALWPGHASAVDLRRLQNRLELWSNYARRTKNMMARLITTRETSLLDDPLVTQGAIVFDAPRTLLLRDDGLSGSATLIDADTVLISPNRPTLQMPPPVDPSMRDAQRWLANVLVRLFAPPPPGDGGEQALVESLRVNVPKRGFRLELMPARGSIVRKTFRSLTIDLDPVTGSVNQLLLAHAQGDQLRMQLADHRQNVDPEDVDAVLETVRARVRSKPDRSP